MEHEELTLEELHASLPSAAGVQTRGGKWFASTVIHGQETSESGLTPVRPFVSTPANVAVGLGLTVNLGNYESARIFISRSEPCYSAEAEATYRATVDWVAARVMKQRDEIVAAERAACDARRKAQRGVGGE